MRKPLPSVLTVTPCALSAAQRSAHELPMVERQDTDSCLVYGGQQMILTGQNFTAESKVVFTEKTTGRGLPSLSAPTGAAHTRRLSALGSTGLGVDLTAQRFTCCPFSSPTTHFPCARHYTSVADCALADAGLCHWRMRLAPPTPNSLF